MTQIDPTTPEGAAYWLDRRAQEYAAEVAEGEQQRAQLQGEVDHLRNELAVAMRALAGLTEAVFDAAQKAVAAAQLGEMLTNDQGEPEQ